jgi:predicted Fe-Mo cluster-binding NifX family protein
VTRGTATGKLVAGHNVDAVITGHIGRKATKALEEAGIKIYLGATGKVREAIKAFQAGLYG